MPDLNPIRRKLKIAVGSMLAADAIALGLLISPLVGSSAARQQEMNGLWQTLQVRTHEVQPLRGLDKKIPMAAQQINDFYQERLPARASDVAEAMSRVASENGVKLARVKYQTGDPVPVQLLPVSIEAEVEGSYPQLARFINGLERSQTLFIIDSIDLQEQNGPVHLQLKVETFLRTGS